MAIDNPPAYVIGIVVASLIIFFAFVLSSHPVQSGSGTVGSPASMESPAQEINAAAVQGVMLDSSIFEASLAPQCTLVQISQCNNNEPSQFICVNQQYAPQVESQFSYAHGRPALCPQFMLAGYIHCEVSYGSCVVVDDGSGS